MKKAIVSVINDLVTDQRVNKTCTALAKLDFSVTLVGRIKKDSIHIDKRSYKTHRMKLIFEKGPFFYAEYNMRLFLYLLFHKCDLLFSNDLDTLLPNYIIHKIKRIPIIFDSHEYFTETPELVNRKFIQKIWKKIERSILPKLDDIITVNKSIAKLFENEYDIEVKVVRNIPQNINIKSLKSRKELDLPEYKKILILQGSGINIQRGAEELIEAMKYVNDAILLIIGGGDIFDKLEILSQDSVLKEKIMIKQKMLYEQLFHYTANADIGVTIDKDTNINYRYSLPNKLFDYIHAGIPVLASKLPEIQKIVEKYDIGEFIPDHNPRHIGDKLNEMLHNKQKLQRWKENIIFASKELTWEQEEKQLIKILKKYA